LLGFLGFLLGCHVVVNAILQKPVQGWSSTILAVVLIGAVQLIMFGIAGEYLWRTLAETRKRPLYFVEQRSLGAGPPAAQGPEGTDSGPGRA
jgi:dolichol-phosphate mannosyltransferase